MRFGIAPLVGVLLLAASCGGDDSGPLSSSEGNDDGPAASTGSLTADIDPCGLFTEAELTAVFGVAYTSEESEPAGPFTGCSWGTGELLISLATTDEPILAPGQEDECPSVGLGDRSFNCPGKVTVLVDGIQYSVTTISPLVTEEDLISLAGVVLPKLAQ